MGGGAVDPLSGAVSSQIGKLGAALSAVQPFYYSTPTINILPSKDIKKIEQTKESFIRSS